MQSSENESLIKKIDYWIEPIKFRLTFWLSALVIVSPFTSWLFDNNIIEIILTTVYTCYMILLFILTLNRFENDEGQFAVGPAFSRYVEVLKNSWGEVSSSIKDRSIMQYLFGKKLIYIGIIWWASTEFFQFIRFILIDFTSASGEMSMKLIRLGSSLSLPIIIVGIILLYLASKKNKDINDILKGDWKYLTFAASRPGIVKRDYKIALKDQFVFDLSKKTSDDLKELKNRISKDLREIMDVISAWQVRRYEFEWQYEDSLVRKLKREFPLYEIIKQFPIKTLGGKNNYLDIVINDSIVLELKRDTKTSSINTGTEQLIRYSTIWKDKGPIILVLCRGDLKNRDVDLNNFFITNKKINSFAVLAKNES